MNEGTSENVKARAYQIWEEEGRPEGRDTDHWLRAEQEMGGADDIRPADLNGSTSLSSTQVPGLGDSDPLGKPAAVPKDATSPATATAPARAAKKAPAAAKPRAPRKTKPATK